MFQKLDHILIQTNKKFYSKLFGDHRSVFSGSGFEFKEIREYGSGDDIRHINWKVTAKNKIATVNSFDDTKQLNIALIYLNSGGMSFGTSKKKIDVANEILASLGYIALKSSDMVTTVIYDDNDPIYYKATKNKNQLKINFQTISNIDPVGLSVTFSSLNNYIANKIKKNSLIFLIGDFLEDEIDLGFLSYRYELYTIVVRDKDEECLSMNGRYNFIDSKSLDESIVEVDETTIKKYKTLVETHDKNLIEHFKKNRIRYKKIYTNSNVVDDLASLLVTR